MFQVRKLIRQLAWHRAEFDHTRVLTLPKRIAGLLPAVDNLSIKMLTEVSYEVIISQGPRVDLRFMEGECCTI